MKMKVDNSGGLGVVLRNCRHQKKGGWSGQTYMVEEGF